MYTNVMALATEIYGKMNEKTDSIMRSSRLWVTLNLAEKTVRQKIELKLKAESLPNLHWFDVLFILANSPDGARPFELGNQLLFEQPNVSRLVRRLVDKGYVVEIPFPEDRRGKILKITMSGDVIARKIWRIYGKEVDRIMGEISKKHDADVFLDALTLLLDKTQLESILRGGNGANKHKL